MSLLSGRRPKWHPTQTPPPSPVILQLPRRHRRRPQKGESGGKVAVAVADRRERVTEEREREEEEEKERFQADVLRAECSLLRRERENAVKEMERNRVDMERTLRSALNILGQKKIYQEHKGKGVLDGEMDILEKKLEELLKENVLYSDSETKKGNHFNKKSLILQKRLENFSGESKEKLLRGIKERAQVNFSLESIQKVDDRSSISAQNNCNKSFDVEILRRKMEGISKGVYERMEDEYGAMFLSNTHTPSTSKRFEFPSDDPSCLSTRPPHQEKRCSGHCKTIVRKIMEQVREESKQWSEMQEMLGQLKQEMDQLKYSHDFWQNRALDNEHQIQSLHSTAQEWKRKAVTIRSKAKELKKEVSVLRRELNNFEESQNGETIKIKDNQKIVTLGAQIAKEKRELVYRLKEKENYRSASREIEQENLNNSGRRKSQVFDHGLEGSKRFPFQNIGNSTIT